MKKLWVVVIGASIAVCEVFAQGSTPLADPQSAHSLLAGKSFTHPVTWQGRNIRMYVSFGADGSIKVSGSGSTSRRGGSWKVDADGKVCRRYEWNPHNVVDRCDDLAINSDGTLQLGDQKLSP